MFAICHVFIFIFAYEKVWDTAGQEKFRAMTPMYYRNANAALLIFDITNHNTFNEMKGWIQELNRFVLIDYLSLFIVICLDFHYQ